MLVKKQNVQEVVNRLSREEYLALDTETYGLGHYDEMFSLIIADGSTEHYFNFNLQADHEGYLPPEHFVLDEIDTACALDELFDDEDITWFIHNAKFDMRRLSIVASTLKGTVHCTEVGARLERNDHMTYTLKACAKRLGVGEKDDAVEEYITKHKLYEQITIPGKKGRVKNKFYSKVPLNIMVPYAKKDARLHYQLGMHQIKEGVMKGPVKTEQALTKVCFDMESKGIRINKKYVQEAVLYETTLKAAEVLKFNLVTGHIFRDSNKTLAGIFDELDIGYPKTVKGNPSFSASSLATISHPVVDSIKKIRGHEKNIGTYYTSFLHYADDKDLIHANIRQAGTGPGRFSYSNPNLQNIPKEDNPDDKQKAYTVRGSFIPREGNCFVSIDYDQMEYRMMLDYANETKLIDQVMDGIDVHQATANLMGVTRKEAKTINFMLLYGGGTQKLADALGISFDRAQDLKNLYFSKLPNVKQFIRGVIHKGKHTGFVTNWAGRRCNIHDEEHAYKLPNHLIQGGCADVIKSAMVRIDNYLAGTCSKSKLLVNIHDELLFDMHPDDFTKIGCIALMMEQAYKPFTNIKLTVGVDHSYKSWSYWDKIEGSPC